MNDARFVGAARLRRLPPVPDAIGVREGPARSPQRTRLPVDGGELLVMPASNGRGVGVKLVTVAPGNPGRGLPLVQAACVLFAPGTLEPLAVIDATAHGAEDRCRLRPRHQVPGPG